MKKLFRFMGWLIALAILLGVAGHFTLRHALNTPKFKAAATGFIERSIGRSAEYDTIDYSLFPFSLIVKNAVLKEKNPSQNFASMKDLSFFVDFKTKEVTSILLEQPTIRIVQHPDGTYNFSDLFPSPPTEPATPQTEPSTTPSTPSKPVPAPPPPADPFSIRLVQIENAQVEFIALDEENNEESFVLSNIDFQLNDFAPDRPFHMNGSATLGKTSSLQFELSGPALAAYAHRMGAWPIAFGSRLDIGNFADLKAFLPPETLPFESLWMTLNIQGSITDKLSILLHIKTPDATETHPVSLDVGFHADLSLPELIAQHLLAGTPLPESLSPAPPTAFPCTPPPGAIALTDNPTLALLLQHLQATLELTFPAMAYANNRFTDGSISAFLRSGVLTIPHAKLSAYGGTLDARGNAQLLACPLSYRLDRLVADRVEIKQALDANGLRDLANISGLIHVEGSLSGHAVAEPSLRSLEAETSLRIDHLQSVGTGGSLMDQVWVKLDHPLLLKLLPHLQPKVDQAKQTTSTISTSHYDEATATLVLHNGKASLSGTRLSMPGYRLDLSGAIFPFDDRMDLSAHLVASPEETAHLTDGKDLSAYLPYEKGSLTIPLFIQGPLQNPRVLPDFDLLLKNALNATVGQDIGNHLNNLSDSDKKNVQQGLQVLQGIGSLFLKP